MFDPIELIAVSFNIVYVVLAARENIWCWPFGILGSLLSVWLFYEAGIYAEALLFVYYVVMGFYGWYNWKNNTVKEGLSITNWTLSTHIQVMLGGYVGTFLLYQLLHNYTDAQMPLLDSFTTIFSFITTWMVARRLLENWIYWIAINALSIYLYFSRDLNVYAILALIYTFMSIYGYITWNKDFRKQVKTA